MNWPKNLDVSLERGVWLAPRTTLKLGPKAMAFVSPRSISGLKELLVFLKKNRIPFRVIGGGSNILACGRRLDCAVISLSAFRKIIPRGASLVEAGSGASLGRIVRFCAKRGLSGAESFSGIPGTLGGALVGNAGAWGKNISDLVEKIRVMDYNCRVKILNEKEAGFGYRASGLSRYIVLGATLRLKKSRKRLIAQRMKKYSELRRQKQELSCPSAGSVFKNPGGGRAGRLIEACGLKGRRIGGAGISLKHANFIVNRGGAKASDVLKLMALIKRRVRQKFGVVLEPEIKIWH